VRSRSLDSLGAEFDDLLDKMQSPQAKKAMAAAFNASPAKLGRAAVKAARKRG
jgi:antitoxin Phd